MLILLAGGMLLLIAAATHFSGQGSLDNIKSKTVGDGQHGTARWATKKEISQTYTFVPFTPEAWRKGENLPKKQGLVLGCQEPQNKVKALVDTDDIHTLITAASGVGKTAFFYIPTLNTPWPPGCPSSTPRPQGSSSASTPGSHMTAASTAPSSACGITPARTGTISCT